MSDKAAVFLFLAVVVLFGIGYERDLEKECMSGKDLSCLQLEAHNR